MDFNIHSDERSKAINYCRIHLGVHWRNVDDSNISVAKLRGGLSNLLYRCKIICQSIVDKTTTNGDDITNKETDEVLLRLYGPTHSETETQLEVFKKLANVNLGPKLYSQFDEGRLEQYLPSKALTWKQMTDHDISAVIARKIASIHKLDLSYCLAKNEGNWLLNQFQELNEFHLALKENQETINSLFQSSKLSETTLKVARQLLTEIDFQSEIKYMRLELEKLDKTLVFSHNDLHQNNILLLDDQILGYDVVSHRDEHETDGERFNVKDKDIESLDQRIVLIDYEFCSYNYRAFDLANHLSEWCFDYSGDEYPYFNVDKERFPSEERQREFLRHYARQLLLDNGNLHDKSSDTNNKTGQAKMGIDNDFVESLFKEMQPLAMASNLLWSLWAVKSAFTSNISFGYWEMAKSKWDIYVMCKTHYENANKN